MTLGAGIQGSATLQELFDASTSCILKVGLAVALGIAIGRINVRGLRLGVSGVLFSALLMGQLGMTLQPEVLSFARDFSLVLFVYAIGLQVGPGFFTSLRSEGVRLNLLATAVVVLGAVLTAMFVWAARLPRDSASGLYSGAYTTTPGLAAGQVVLRQLLADAPGSTNEAMSTTGLAYAVSYPFGLVGPILVLVFVRRLFRIDMSKERAELDAQRATKTLSIVDFEVTERVHAGLPLRALAELSGRPVTLSRLYRGGTMSVPTADTIVELGDVYRAVGDTGEVDQVVALLGRPSKLDLGAVGGNLIRKDLLVTKPQVLRKTLRDLDLPGRTGVAIARVSRAGIEIAPTATLALKFADHVTAIGPEAGMKLVEEELGNEESALNRASLMPVFLGIVAGVLVGAIPIRLPGMPVPLKIGLAGGPMLAAIGLSQLGSVGSVVWYMPAAANQMVRDLGLAIFLACIGFQCGGGFLERAAHGGAWYIVLGAVVTVLPLFLVACFARYVLRMNFVTLSGWLAGAMTSMPALLFANEATESEAPAVAFAAVAPVSEILPIICAELLAVWMGA